MAALAEVEQPGDLARLDQDARGWMRLWLSGLAALGLTPASAARLGALRASRGMGVEELLAAVQGEAA